MKTPNVLERPGYLNLPQSENDLVGQISRDNIACRAWLAGIMDGEGTIGINGNNARGMGQIRLEIKNTSPYMIRRISEIYKMWNIPFHYNYARFPKKQWKEQLAITVTGMRSIRKILRNMLPFLTAKKEEAELMLDYLDWRLDSMPFHTSNAAECMQINCRRDKVKALLTAIKKRQWSLQRLPRGASTILNLDKLEIIEAKV